MSKSLKRVKNVLEAFDDTLAILETDLAKTAPDAAAAIGCEVDQIAKSIIFQGQQSGTLYLFITPGAHRVDPDRAAALTGEALGKADAQTVRRVTGFAIGGVSPTGHLTPIKTYVDDVLFQFDQVYAAAGTPHHVFGCTPDQLLHLSQGDKQTFATAM